MSIPTYTGFFREQNLADFSRELAPELAAQAGGTLLVGEVGCSSGEESWSLAASLETNGVDYRIEGYDINQEALRRATAPYPLPRVESLAAIIGETDYPAGCLSHFVINKTTIYPTSQATVTPSSQLQSKVALQSRDILVQPLPKNRYGAIVLNNILYHHHDKERDSLFENSLTGLAAGGVALIESFYRRHPESYLAWRMQIPDRFGLEPLNLGHEDLPTAFRKL